MNIEDYRARLDEIDTDIVKLVEDRLHVSREIAEFKKENSIAVTDTERERKLLSFVSELCNDKENGRYMQILYLSMLSISRSCQNSILQKPTAIWNEISSFLNGKPFVFPDRCSVACQGVEGDFSQMATDKMIHFPDIFYFRTYEAVFKALDEGMCEFAVLPLENSTSGSINQIYKLLSKYGFFIVQSTRLHVQQSLLAHKGVRKDKIREIIGHELSISQCRGFLDSIGNIIVSSCPNSRKATSVVAASDRNDFAAIAPASLATSSGLSIIEDDIQDGETNYTRFVCISKKFIVLPGANKTSLSIIVKHRPGELHNLLSKFQSLGINIAKFETRHILNNDSDLQIYVDFDESIYSDQFQAVLLELSRDSGEFRFLGSYVDVM